MPILVCTRHLANIGPCEPVEFDGGDVRAVLDAAAKDHPRLKSYVLDDHGVLRKHVVIFIDGVMQKRAGVLDAPLLQGSEVCVFQALSGG
ncbi:MAG: MoaD/ThiS family protein [Caulobacterales bacterium]